MKLLIALLLIVLKQKKKHMQTEPRELLFIRAEAQSLQWQGTGSLLNKKGTNTTLALCGQGPVFAPLGRWMEALRRCALPVRHPVSFVSLRAAAAEGEKVLLHQESQLRLCTACTDCLGHLGDSPSCLGKHTTGTQERTQREYLLSFTSPRTATH